MASKKSSFQKFIDRFRRKRLRNLESRLVWKKKVLDLKADLQSRSHSLLWVWEFSKKAVLICFIFYVVVQLYAMAVMINTCDFTYLSDLINQTGEIVQNCVFGYLVKAGVENIGKIIFSNVEEETDDEAVG